MGVREERVCFYLATIGEVERQFFRGCLRTQLDYVADKAPLTAEMLRSIDAELAAGEPRWFVRLNRAWKSRRFGPHYEATLLLLAALHREALAGRAPGLAKTLPSCGGFSAGAGAAAVEVLNAASPSFFDALKDERLQTNEPARAVAWLLPSCAAFLSRGTPFHLVELGASAGLLLVGDYLPRSTALLLSTGEAAAEPDRWRDIPYPLLSRHGLDARPRSVADAEDRLWLKASIWPHDLERLERFERAAELFARLSRESAGPRLREATFAEMPGWIAKTLRPHPEEGLLLFNAQATDFLPDGEYAALESALARVLEPWGDRGLWVELELPRGGAAGEHELRAHRWLDGRFQARVLARADAHARGLRLERGWDFLRPLAPVIPPRNTREEPARQLEAGKFSFPGKEA